MPTRKKATMETTFAVLVMFGYFCVVCSPHDFLFCIFTRIVPYSINESAWVLHVGFHDVGLWVKKKWVE